MPTPPPQTPDPSAPLTPADLTVIAADLSDILTRYAEISRRLAVIELNDPLNITAARAGNFCRWMMHNARYMHTEISTLKISPDPTPLTYPIHENDFDHED